jgi:hypothetical protein
MCKRREARRRKRVKGLYLKPTNLAKEGNAASQELPPSVPIKEKKMNDSSMILEDGVSGIQKPTLK